MGGRAAGAVGEMRREHEVGRLVEVKVAAEHRPHVANEPQRVEHRQ